MRILLVIPEFPPDFGGGIVAFYRDLVPALRAQGCAVTVLKGSAYVHGAATYEREGVRVEVLETRRYEHWLDQFVHFAMFPELRRHLAASFALHEQAKAGEGFDVVEVTDWGMLFLPWVIGAQARVLVQLHGSTGQIAHHEPVAGHEAEGIVSLLLEKTALSLSPGLCSYSRPNVLWWQGVLGRSVDYLPPPLGLSPLEQADDSCVGGWLAVGRIQRWKGPQVACAAWQFLGDNAPQLEWIGRDTFHGASGKSTDAWLKESYAGVWRERIHPVGQLLPAEVARRISAAKAVIVPSTWDVFNLAAAEAMAHGKPVVISDGAGAADLVQHGVNGFVFPNGDASALAECVRHVENLDAGELLAIGRAAALTVRERLDPMRIAEGKLALYRQLPEAQTRPINWLCEWLSPATGRSPFGFLDGLPLKELTRYVARRGLRKVRRADHKP